jgi:hypothetical protein
MRKVYLQASMIGFPGTKYENLSDGQRRATLAGVLGFVVMLASAFCFIAHSQSIATELRGAFVEGIRQQLANGSWGCLHEHGNRKMRKEHSKTELEDLAYAHSEVDSWQVVSITRQDRRGFSEATLRGTGAEETVQLTLWIEDKNTALIENNADDYRVAGLIIEH